MSDISGCPINASVPLMEELLRHVLFPTLISELTGHDSSFVEIQMFNQGFETRIVVSNRVIYGAYVCERITDSLIVWMKNATKRVECDQNLYRSAASNSR